MKRCLWVSLIQIWLMERSIGKCDKQHSDLICCVHAKAGAKGLVIFCLWCFLCLLLISGAWLQKVWFLTEMQLLELNSNSEHSRRERTWEMRYAAASKWIWRTWLLHNKKPLGYILLTGGNERAMILGHVSKACNAQSSPLDRVQVLLRIPMALERH